MEQTNFIILPPQTVKPRREVIRRGGDADHDKSFCLFAVRANSEESVGKRKLNSNTTYYLMQGFEIDGKYIYVKRTTIQGLEDSIYNQLYTQQSSKAHLNISAIVGMNGSGKSTLVEYILRLINNFSASTFGEIKTSAATERLHYIPGVDGDLFYMQYGHPYILSVRNEHVSLKRCDFDNEKSDSERIAFVSSKYTFYDNNCGDDNVEHSCLFKDLGIDSGLKHLFYTIVLNHSMYAYNTNDYADEADSNMVETIAEALYIDSLNQKRRDQNDIKEKEFPLDQRCWLHGLFHKNDGYQVPLVLTPYRHEGNIDINNENRLARERLIALIVDPKSTFRQINDHLVVDNLVLSRSASPYDYEHVKSMLNSRTTFTLGAYEIIRIAIYEVWCDVLGMDLSWGSDKSYYQDTINYVCYKTLKIAKTYREYRYYFDKMRRKKWLEVESVIEELVGKLLLDNSHITNKLFQAIDYVAYDIYTDEILSKPVVPSNLKLSQSNKTHEGKQLLFRNLHNCQHVKHIPSPIFDVKINLMDIHDGHKVGFETLSSGEKQLTYAVSSLLYHLSNIDSVKEDGNGLRIVYSHINLILEEIELYFHPDLQKRFVKYLIEGIGQMQFISLRAINIILVTHSPFVLSDIPSSNILALKKDGSVTENIKSFASNIHEMLKDSFFLEKGSIGDFAQEHINKIIADLRAKEDFIDVEKLHRRIMLIDEPVVRLMLLEEFRKEYPQYAKSVRKTELLKELNDLED